MSGDEVFALIASSFFNLITWLQWLWLACRIDRFHQPGSAHAVVGGAAAAAVVLLVLVLRYWASWDVRDSALYTMFYLLMGMAFTAGTLIVLGAMGLSLRDDVFERRNPAAAIALGGAIVGGMMAFAGGNIGDGPGWWVVVFCALMSNGAMLLGWVMLDRIGAVGDAITIDRDRATAWRTAGWFSASGAIFGRGAAGDWTTGEAAVADFVEVGIGGLVLLIAAVAVERTLRSSGTRSDPLLAGQLPATLYLCGAIAYVTLLHPL